MHCSFSGYKLFLYYLVLLSTLLYSCHLTKCKVEKEWEIGEYKIEKKVCLGPAGPSYSSINIYAVDKSSWVSGFENEDSTITCQFNDDLYLIFDVNKNVVTKIVSDKKKIDLSVVDSIRIFSNELQQAKLLSKDAVSAFITDWNQSKTSDYREGPVDSIFYPMWQYKLTVYTRNGKSEFLGANYLVSNRTNWTYYINDDEDVEYFTKLWRKD